MHHNACHTHATATCARSFCDLLLLSLKPWKKLTKTNTFINHILWLPQVTKYKRAYDLSRPTIIIIIILKAIASHSAKALIFCCGICPFMLRQTNYLLKINSRKKQILCVCCGMYISNT